MKKIIERYKQLRKQAALGREYAHRYAFVGMGNHSLQNLYPVLNYLNVPLKYIVTRSEKSAEIARRLYQNCETTTDLDRVLADESVKGVFICTTPAAHYHLVKKALTAGKHVFVEKPPCTSPNELDILIETEKKQHTEVFVGLQRRYSPAFSILKSKLKNANHYIYRYTAGAFPEGDAPLELFIHPIDSIQYLFGKAEIKSCLRRKNTYLLNVLHENGIIGNVELSADYSWKESLEYLSVNTNDGVFIINGLDSLVFHKKPRVVINIPMEKIAAYTPQHTVLFNRNTFIPNVQNNDLYVHGFYGEVKSFVGFCENGNRKLNKSRLDEIRDTFELLNNLL